MKGPLNARLEDTVAGGVEVKQRGQRAVGAGADRDEADELSDLAISRAARIASVLALCPGSCPSLHVGHDEASRFEDVQGVLDERVLDVVPVLQ